MQTVRQKLLNSDVIRDVVNDFFPRVRLYVIYGHKRIILGEDLSLTLAQSLPDNFECECDARDLEMRQILASSKFVIIMTDPLRTPGCEYLHWLITDYEPVKRRGRVIPWEELVAYEPPTYMRTRKIVFTLFRQNQSWAPKHQPRVLFSTRVFAGSNSLRSPLAAAFCYIKDVNQTDPNESPTSSTARGEPNTIYFDQ